MAGWVKGPREELGILTLLNGHSNKLLPKFLNASLSYHQRNSLLYFLFVYLFLQGIVQRPKLAKSQRTRDSGVHSSKWNYLYHYHSPRAQQLLRKRGQKYCKRQK